MINITSYFVPALLVLSCSTASLGQTMLADYTGSTGHDYAFGSLEKNITPSPEGLVIKNLTQNGLGGIGSSSVLDDGTPGSLINKNILLHWDDTIIVRAKLGKKNKAKAFILIVREASREYHCYEVPASAFNTNEFAEYVVDLDDPVFVGNEIDGNLDDVIIEVGLQTVHNNRKAIDLTLASLEAASGAFPAADDSDRTPVESGPSEATAEVDEPF